MGFMTKPHDPEGFARSEAIRKRAAEIAAEAFKGFSLTHYSSEQEWAQQQAYEQATKEFDSPA